MSSKLAAVSAVTSTRGCICSGAPTNTAGVTAEQAIGGWKRSGRGGCAVARRMFEAVRLRFSVGGIYPERATVTARAGRTPNSQHAVTRGRPGLVSRRVRNTSRPCPLRDLGLAANPRLENATPADHRCLASSGPFQSAFVASAVGTVAVGLPSKSQPARVVLASFAPDGVPPVPVYALRPMRERTTTKSRCMMKSVHHACPCRKKAVSGNTSPAPVYTFFSGPPQPRHRSRPRYWQHNVRPGAFRLDNISLSPEGICRISISVKSFSRTHERRIVPEIVLLDAANRPHLSNLGTGAYDLDPHVCPGLDDSVLIVSELWRCGVGVPFDVARNQLHIVSQVMVRQQDQMYAHAPKQKTQWPSLGEETLRVDRVHHGIDLAIVSDLLLSKHDRSIPDRELGQPIARQNPTLGNVERVHDRDDVVAAGTGALDVLQQLAGHQLVHISAEIGGVQGDPALHVVEKEHAGRLLRRRRLGCACRRLRAAKMVASSDSDRQLPVRDVEESTSDAPGSEARWVRQLGDPIVVETGGRRGGPRR
ncbi:hypothetical protein ACCO45_003333 [Purpureocillium lilacinum]|uniref:Uncharacterized protein n=1 Tax=Purpureocillium lilacinum TaxID=33203 RepID=A0ACC4DZM8_PURLI